MVEEEQEEEQEGAATMDPENTIKTRNFLVTVFRTFDVSNDGRLSRSEVDRVLAALGRRWATLRRLFTIPSRELRCRKPLLVGTFPSLK